MSDYFGPEIGRHLSSEDRQFSDVLYLPDGPIIAEEFILGASIDDEKRQELLQNNVPSGWITNPSNPKEDFQFDRKNSNQFWFGKDGSERGDIPYAVVNGWMVPVAGTNNSNDFRNVVQLPPPPSSVSTTNTVFVFLEVWEARISPGNDVNKPSQNEIYRFGNVDYGGNNLDEEMVDPRFEKESSERTQIQYRMRVVNGVDPSEHPYGFNPSITAQGPLDSPLSTPDPDYEYENMGEELNDPGLWRAGVGHQLDSDKQKVLSQSDLETVDGYVYAVPLCFVFRRTSQNWTITNQMGAYDRNESMTQADEAEMLPTVQLNGALSRDETSDFEVDTSQSSTKFDPSGGLMKIDDEVVEYSDYTGTTVTIDQRGAENTHVEKHHDGAQVDHVSGHPESLFSDQIVRDDIHDLRHATSFGDWDFDSLLEENFQKLAKDELKTQWKTSKSDITGLKHFQVDYFGQSPLNSNYVEERDRLDGFRKVFSDACVPQPDNLLVAAPNQDVTDTELETNPTADVFKFNDTGGTWLKGDSIEIPLNQFQSTFDDVSDQKMRFIHPDEYVDTTYDPMEIWFGQTYENNSISGLQSPVDARGSNPNFLVFGKQPDLSSAYVENDNVDITFDDTVSPAVIDPNNTDFSQQSPGGNAIGEYLADRDAWIIIRDETSITASGASGAYKIEGVGTTSTGPSSEGLKVVDIDGNAPDFGGAETTSTADWYIRYEECTEEDEQVFVVLGAGLPGTPADEFVDSHLFLNFDVLYHPARGLTRCPKEMPEVRLGTNNDSYLRERKSFSPRTANQGRKYKPVPMETYPHDRTGSPLQDIRDLQSSIEEVWSEAYVDRGSKTFLFQPIRKLTATVEAQSQNASLPTQRQTLLADVGFDGDTSNDPVVTIPGELAATPGRVDVPFVDTQTSNPEPPWGINTTILQDAGINANNENFVVRNFLSVYDHVNLACNPTQGSSDYNTVVDLSNVGSGGPTRDAVVMRYYNEGEVEGLEMSMHLGFSRIYGIYEQSDFYTNNIAGRGEFVPGANNLYRQKDSNFNGTNLLRTDGERRSVFITDRNSFVIPRDIIDETSLSNDFEDTAFIVESALFAFREWTNDRIQLHPKAGEISTSATQQLEMLANAPADAGAEVNAISTRIPYQGNVSGTMPSSTTNTSNTSYSDYSPKRESEDQSKLDLLNKDLDTDQARVENPVRAEILSMMPFATSLGTGRISGEVKHGAYTDVGYLDKSGFPDASQVGTQRYSRSRGLTHLEEVDHQERTISDRLTGLTEQLPVGLYASDHQFIGEGFYGQQERFWKDIEVDFEGHGTYKNDELMNDSLPEGSLVLADGTAGGASGGITYENDDNLYRTYRGGTAMNEEGGPILVTGDRVYKEYPFLRDFTTEYLEALENNSFSPGQVDKQAIMEKHEKRLQIHGSVLFGIAFLMRTGKEEVTDNDIAVNYGDELQMGVLTGSVFGQDLSLDLLSDEQSKEFLDSFVQLHPLGTGEGYCAADRFRLPARPLRTPSRESKEAEGINVFRFED